MTDSSRAPPGSITTNPALNPADLLALQSVIKSNWILTNGVERSVPTGIYSAFVILMLSPLTSMAVYSASTLTVIVIVETSRVIGLSLLGLRMASKSAGLIAGLVVIEPGGALLESVIRFTSSQGVDTSPITLEVSTITITVSVEAEYTAIEVKGDNIKITKAEYIPVGTDVSTPLVRKYSFF
jgi:hypothetical protein